MGNFRPAFMFSSDVSKHFLVLYQAALSAISSMNVLMLHNIMFVVDLKRLHIPWHIL